MIRQRNIYVYMIYLLLLCLFLSACFHEAGTSSGTEDGASFYTVKCPDEVITYAIENYSQITYNTFRINNYRLEDKEISLGYPFTAYEEDEDPAVYIFPVYCNDKIVMTLHSGFLDPDIYQGEDSARIGIVGGTGLLDRVDILQNIFDIADANHPVFFYLDSHENFMASVGSKKIVYWPSFLPDLSEPTYEDVAIPEEHLIKIAIDARLNTTVVDESIVNTRN